MKSEYDAFSKDFSQTRTHSWPEFDILSPHISPQDRLLDLGCGNGRLRRFLPSEKLTHGNYFGLDLSRGLLDIAREYFPQDHFFLGDFSQKFVFGAENFEVVSAIASFHHLLSKKDQLYFLSECNRVLKKDGILFLTTWKLPKKHFWENIFKGRLKNWIIPFGKEKFPRTYRRVSHQDLQKLLKKSGFKIMESRLVENRNYIIMGRKK